MSQFMRKVKLSFGICSQCSCRSASASDQSDPKHHCKLIGQYDPVLQSNRHDNFGSDCMDAQADLKLHSLHMAKCTFSHKLALSCT